MPEGLEAIIFTADGDMRQALNNLQATHSGFRFVNQENVFKVQPYKTSPACHTLWNIICSVDAITDTLHLSRYAINHTPCT